MNQRPFISICIPAYRRPELMKRLLDSIASQSFREFEIIITDDSPDNTVEEIVHSYPQLPIQYFRNHPVAGTPGNWNLAMQKATAPWIHLLHADDWYANPDALARFAAACKNSRHSFVCCASKEMDKQGKVLKELHPKPDKLRQLEEDRLYLVYDNMIGHPSVVLHKRDELLRYNPAFKWVVDIDYYIRFMSKYPGFTYISDCLINIGIDDEQVSATAYKNPAIEIPEYLQLISSLPNKERISNPYVFRALWTLVKKFRIREVADISQYGYQASEPDAIAFIIHAQSGIPRLILKQTNWSEWLVKRYYRKWIAHLEINKR